MRGIRRRAEALIELTGDIGVTWGKRAADPMHRHPGAVDIHGDPIGPQHPGRRQKKSRHSQPAAMLQASHSPTYVGMRNHARRINQEK